MSNFQKTMNRKDYEVAFGEEISQFLSEVIQKCPVEYSEVESAEKEKIIINILDHMKNDFISRAGPKRIKDWDTGWGENLNLVSEYSDINSLIPKYFGKYNVIRFCSRFIKVVNKEAEYNTVKILQTWLFEKFLKEVDCVYEFGCGTGHNLFRVRDINKKAEIYGLDWSISTGEIFKKINNCFGEDFRYKQFDFFNIDRSFELKENSGVYTFAALEQSGEKFKNFIDYLVLNKPKICFHVEPISELLDPENNLNDYLSIEYFKKRNYLEGFYKYLKKLENEGTIEIVLEKRSTIGSLYINGYSIVAWRPNHA
tara:strand:+ start:49 stop:984 length:936 start_codon:yes stop_codon:yes gene_type:complete